MKLLQTSFLLGLIFSQGLQASYESLKKNVSFNISLATETSKEAKESWASALSTKLGSKWNSDTSLSFRSNWDQDSETALEHSRMEFNLAHTLWSEEEKSLSIAYRRRFYRGAAHVSNYNRVGLNYSFPSGTLDSSVSFYYYNYINTLSSNHHAYYIPIGFSTPFPIVEKFEGYAYFEYIKYASRKKIDAEAFTLSLGLVRKLSKKSSLEFYAVMDPFRQGDQRFFAKFLEDYTLGFALDYDLF